MMGFIWENVERDGIFLKRGKLGFIFTTAEYGREEKSKMKHSMISIWIGRALVGTVFIMNVQSAITFLLQPENYAAGFQLSGGEGLAAVRGIGLLFLMWNVPYFVALLEPVKNRVSLYEALAMQSIGVIGETLIFLSLPGGYATLQNSIARFIVFDSLGLAMLLLAVWVTRLVPVLAEKSN